MYLTLTTNNQSEDNKMKELLLELFSSLKNDVGSFRRSKLRKYLTGESALIGGVLGGLAGLLIAATPVLFPGTRFILIGFTIGALVGGLLGALVDLSISYKTPHKSS